MLGLPVMGWLRFFAGGFVAGTLMLLVPFKPIPAIGVFEMTVAAAGLLVVVAYARCYAPWPLRRLRARDPTRHASAPPHRTGLPPAPARWRGEGSPREFTALGPDRRDTRPRRRQRDDGGQFDSTSRRMSWPASSAPLLAGWLLSSPFGPATPHAGEINVPGLLVAPLGALALLALEHLVRLSRFA